MATQVPLKILITSNQLLDQADIKDQLDKLQKAGHDITVDDSFSQYDFITGPNCWLLRPEVVGLFTLAVTNARRIANADQERAQQVKLAQAHTRTTKSHRKTAVRRTTRKGTNPGTEPHSVDPGDATIQPTQLDAFAPGTT